MKFAILVDAGFLKTKLSSQNRPLDVAGVIVFLENLRAHGALSSLRLHRIYWYDAPPLDCSVVKPLRGGRVDFGTTLPGRTNAELLQALCKAPHVSLRRGDLAFRGWKVRKGRLPLDKEEVLLRAQDLSANIHQKGVDMRLGLDIAALTLKMHVDTIVLVAGDSDFVPAMKFARREGARVFLVTLGRKVRPDMLEHSDLVLDVSVPVAALSGIAA